MTTYGTAWFRLRTEAKVIGGLLAVLCAWGVIVVVASSNSSRPAPRAQATAAPTPKSVAGVPSNDITLGSPAAPMTLTVFADLTDARFRHFDANVLPALVNRYVRPGRLQIRLRTLSRTVDDHWAAQLAHAASLQGRMWDFVQVFESSYAGSLDTATARDMFGRVKGLDVNAGLRASRQARVAAAVNRATVLAPSPLPSQPVFMLDGGRVVQLPPLGTGEPGRFLATLASAWSRATPV